MKATDAQLQERLPAWDALSEFFLDTELQPDDYVRIAKRLAMTPYSESEIEEILVCEVCPVCRWNMISVAGEWAGFDREWLKEQIGPRYGANLKFKSLFKLRHRWMYSRHWNKIRAMIIDIRSKP